MTCFLGACSCLGGLLAVTFGIHGLSPAVAQMSAPRPSRPGGGADRRTLRVRRPQSVAGGGGRRGRQTDAGARQSRLKRRSVDESGSGVLIRIARHPGVYVLTNNHVIQQAPADQITISLADNRLLKPSKVWADPESDVAILRLDAADLPAAALGDSDNVRVGQWVLAIGSPFGLNQTVTHGIISARERGQVSLGSTIRIKDFLQTDAAINPGSSGGPLINMDGEVIGINTAIASHSGSNSGVAFSIPINLVKRILDAAAGARLGGAGLSRFAGGAVFRGGRRRRRGFESRQGALVETVYCGYASGGGGTAGARRGAGGGWRGRPQRKPLHQPHQRLCRPAGASASMSGANGAR